LCQEMLTRIACPCNIKQTWQGSADFTVDNGGNNE